jgi:hypothetical protein
VCHLYIASFLAATLLTTLGDEPANPITLPPLDDFHFVFQGTVVKARATAVSAVKATDRTLIVKVKKVIQPSSKAAARYEGKEITVLLDQKQPTPLPEPGAQGVFYTNTLVSGEGLAVEGVADFRPDHATTATAAASARRDDALVRQAANADLVVTGKVVAVNQPPSDVVNAGGKLRITEHPARWREAEIEIQSTEKGPNRQRVHVLFPLSHDVLWKNAPKYKVGQEGIWFLHKNQTESPAVHHWLGAMSASQQDGYTALSPVDFHPKETAERIKPLIERAKGK